MHTKNSWVLGKHVTDFQSIRMLHQVTTRVSQSFSMPRTRKLQWSTYNPGIMLDIFGWY